MCRGFWVIDPFKLLPLSPEHRRVSLSIKNRPLESRRTTPSLAPVRLPVDPVDRGLAARDRRWSSSTPPSV